MEEATDQLAHRDITISPTILEILGVGMLARDPILQGVESPDFRAGNTDQDT